MVHFMPVEYNAGECPIVYTSQPGFEASEEEKEVEAGWMVAPEGMDCPHGLDCLVVLNQLTIVQKDATDVVFGYDTTNRYLISNNECEKVYYAMGKVDSADRCCRSTSRGFVIRIVDYTGLDVMRIRKPYKLFGGCYCVEACSRNAQECVVEAPVGKSIGSIRQLKGFCKRSFIVRNACNEDVFVIEDAGSTFEIRNMDGIRVGEVKIKREQNVVEELLGDDERSIRLSFPLDIDVDLKAILLGAVFLVDFIA